MARLYPKRTQPPYRIVRRGDQLIAPSASRKYLHFAADTYITTSRSIASSSGNYRIECQFTITDSTPATGALFGLAADASLFAQWRGTINLDSQNRIWGGTATGTFEYPLNVDHAMAIEWNSGDTSALEEANGTTSAIVKGADVGTDNFEIGRRFGGTGHIGAIWDVKIINRDTSAILNHWKLDEGPGVTTMVDSVGGSDGTLVIGSGEWKFSKT